MPQISKGGKFVFGWSRINEGGKIRIPERAAQEYDIPEEGRVILISGSKRSGAFSVSTKTLLSASLLSGLFDFCPDLNDFKTDEGEPVKFKNRYYCWVRLHEDNCLMLPEVTMKTYNVKEEDVLLSIRGSNIAFDFAVKGPLVEKARTHPEIELW